MPRYAMVIDLKRCVGCSACTVACRSQWQVPDYGQRTWVLDTGVQGVFPDLVQTHYVGQCNHCDQPACIQRCPTGATYQQKDGVVVVEKDVCVGCGLCLESCPYGARFINLRDKKLDKCDFCAPRLAENRPPACVETCISGAKTFGDLTDRNSKIWDLVYRQGAHRIESDQIKLGPNVYYLGNPKQLNLLSTKFPPQYPEPSAVRLTWKGVKPLILSLVGLSFFGQLIAIIKQLTQSEDTHMD